MVLDESKLSVQADILIDVTRGIVRLRAKDRTNLKDTLKDAHHVLLIKLRTLRQERWPPKVVQLEDVSPALSSPRPPPCSGPSSASFSATTCTIPPPSRTTKKLTPPKRRSECNHPAIRTRSPTCALTSTVCIRSIKKVPFKSSRQTAQQKSPIL